MRRLVSTFTLILWLGGGAALAQQVTKVEPPNWWTSERPMPLTLLLTGSKLQQGKLASSTPGVSVRASRPGAGDRHLFCDITVEPSAKAGPVIFTLETATGTAEVAWELLEPLPAAGRWQGLKPDDVIYFLMVDRFANGDPRNDEPVKGERTLNRKDLKAYHGGDLRGVIQSLDAIEQLGATALWLTPVYQNDDGRPDTYHGYGATDFYAVEDHFGTMADYRELADELHKRGMKLIQDVVPNHCGPTHPWVQSPPTATWIHGTLASHQDCKFDIAVGPNPAATPAQRSNLYEGWFANTLPDLNGRDSEYRRYATQNALWWNHMSGQDALRVDTYCYVDRALWPEWQKALNEHFPQTTQFGEIWHGDPGVISFWRGGKKGWDGIDTGLKSQCDFPLLYAIRAFACKDGGADGLVKLLERDAIYGDAAMNVTFVGNHDMGRILNEAGGNERRVLLAHALLLSLRGIPQIYSGDEIGMAGGGDPDNRRDYPGGFGDGRSALVAKNRNKLQRTLWDEIARLIRVRKEHPALTTGAFKPLLAQGKWLAFMRSSDAERLVFVANGSAEAAKITVPAGEDLPEGSTLKPVGEKAAAVKVRKTGVQVQLPAFGYRLYSVAP
jgi:glycosidase